MREKAVNRNLLDVHQVLLHERALSSETSCKCVLIRCAVRKLNTPLVYLVQMLGGAHLSMRRSENHLTAVCVAFGAPQVWKHGVSVAAVRSTVAILHCLLTHDGVLFLALDNEVAASRLRAIGALRLF